MTKKGSSDYVRLLLTKGKDIPVDTEIDTDKINLPPWYNDKLFKRGQKFYTRNIFAMFVGMFCGLISVLAIPTILKILVSTKKSSNNKTAYQRYLRTIYHIVNWHWYIFGIGNNTNNDDIIKIRNTKIWRSLMIVRKTHFKSSKYCQTTGNGFISQKDMALTQFGFIGFITLKAKLLGLQHNDKTLDGTIHFWRVIGYMLGIQDEYNICTDKWDTTEIRLKEILKEIYKPALLNTNQEFLDMVKPLVGGLWSFSPFLCVDCVLFFTKRLCDCDGYKDFKTNIDDINDNINIKENNSYELYKKMSLWNRFVLSFLITILQYMYPYKIFKWYFNFQIYLSLFLITYIPFLAYHRFGFKDSYVRIKV